MLQAPRAGGERGLPLRGRFGRTPSVLRPFHLPDFDPNIFYQQHDLSGMLENNNWYEVEQKLYGHINLINFCIIPRASAPEFILHENGTVERPETHQILAFYEPDDQALKTFCQENELTRFIPGSLQLAVCDCEGCTSDNSRKIFNFIKNVHLGNVGLDVEEDGSRGGALVSVVRDSVPGELGGPVDIVSAVLEGLHARRLHNEIDNVKFFGVKMFGEISQALFGRRRTRPPLTQVAYNEMELLVFDRNADGGSKLCIDYVAFENMPVAGRFANLMRENGRIVPETFEPVPVPTRLHGLSVLPYIAEARENYTYSSIAHRMFVPKEHSYAGVFPGEVVITPGGARISSTVAGPSR